MLESANIKRLGSRSRALHELGIRVMSQEFINDELIGPDGLHFSIGGESDEVAAWTEIEAGRFMPRRVRGSFQGRALG